MTLTPKQFKLLATKEDLKDLVTKEEFEQKMDQVLTKLDSIAKNFTDHKTEHLSNQAAHDRFEKRLTRLEKRVGLKAVASA